MAKIQDIDIPHLEFAEAAAPGTPASGIVRIYAKTDGKLYQKDDAGTESGLVTAAGSTTFVGARVYNNATQAIPDATPTALTFNSEEFDSDGFHDTGSATDRLTIPSGKDGYYLIRAHTAAAADPDAERILFLRKNGSDIIGGAISQYGHASITGSPPARMEVSVLVSAVATNYFQAMIYSPHGGGGNLNYGGASDGASSTFEIIRVGT